METRSCSHLFGVGEIELGGQIDDLQLDDVFFVGERLGHLPQDVGGDLRDVLAVFADQPQDAGPRHRHLANNTHTDMTLLLLLLRRRSPSP